MESNYSKRRLMGVFMVVLNAAFSMILVKILEKMQANSSGRFFFLKILA